MRIVQINISGVYFMFEKKKVETRKSSLPLLPRRQNGRKNIKTGSVLGVGSVIKSQVRDTNITTRALNRVGKNKNIKGTINEIMTVDKFNKNPVNLLQGKRATLTKSTNAVRDDIIIKKGKKVVGRAQLKDTPSPSGIRKTINQVKDKHYKGTNLIGTKETAKEFAKKASQDKTIKQKMTSNGISSKETSLLAAKALGGDLSEHTKVILTESTKRGGKVALTTAGVEGIKNAVAVKNGEKEIKEALGSVASETAIITASSIAGETAQAAVTIAAAPVAGPAAPVVGMAAGMGTNIVTEKALRKGGEFIAEKVS